jgi:hypothetical protein
VSTGIILKRVFYKNSKLAQYAYEQAKEVDGIGPYGVFGKPNQPTQSGYCPIWIPLIIDEVTTSKGSP